MAETWGVGDWNAVAREYTADKGWQEAGARAVAKLRARMERELEEMRLRCDKAHAAFDEALTELEALRAKFKPPPGTWKFADDWLEDSRLTADAREIVEFLKSLAEPPKTKRELAKEALQSMPGVTWFGDTVDQVVDAVMGAMGVEDGDG